MIPFELRLLIVLSCAGGAGCHEGGERVASRAEDADTPARRSARTVADDRGSRTSQTLLATSPSHSCALRETGLYCWGQNFSGQLGTGDLVDSESAVAATVGGADIVQVALSTGRTCVRRSTGTVACWGINEHGQRGDGTRQESVRATAVVGLEDAVGLAIDDETSCVVRGAERRPWCWGGSPAGDAEGRGLLPVTIANVSGVVELRSGVNGEYCGRLQNGSVRCWSLKEDGWTAAVEVPALSGARSIAMAAFDEVCAVVGPGPILCHNLENGKTVPLDKSAGSVRVIGTGSLAACAVNGEGAWHCWNVLPPMLETVGSPRIDASADEPAVDLVFSGFRVCVLFPENEVACGEVTDWGLPELVRVAGLPD